MITHYVLDNPNSIERHEAYGLELTANDTVTIKKMGYVKVTGPSPYHAISAPEGGNSFDIEGLVSSESGIGISIFRSAAVTIGATGRVVAPMSAILASGGSCTIRNEGRIESAWHALSTLDFTSSLTTHALVVLNSGTIINTAHTQEKNTYAINAGAGADVIINSGLIHGSIRLFDSNDVYLGSGGFLNGFIDPGAGDDSIQGGSGAETFHASIGNDTLEGGGDNDTVIFSGTLGEYTFTRNADGSVTVADTAAYRDGTDLLWNVELVRFADQIVSLSSLASTPELKTPRLASTKGNDILKGSDGNDLLFGKLGKDKLTGGAGKDVFAFDSKPGRKNVDTLTDFQRAEDDLWLDNKVFKALGKKGSEDKPQKLKKAFFTLGPKAKDQNDFIVYDRKKGILYYDKDGSGEAEAIAFAKLKKGAALTAADLFVI